ncbi:hypothetical protein MNBD_PLANCTO02-2012 [hydrothermal vent metagenome]|uniref:ATP synthase F1 complex delta/epsilon subunit N-terminal domain-containing protein n=1 Tax=hydrothermal vent metagenome TaxID=652676 RepID=A0A3B1DIV6_9ZZZZ
MAESQLQLVLVTPETTLLNEPVISLRFPLFDGQMGILPGRAPVVGRLGEGELSITTANGEKSYFIDGGFVQIKGKVVSLLTNRAIQQKDLNEEEAITALEESQKLAAQSDDEFLEKFKAQQRARKMIFLAKKPR